MTISYATMNEVLLHQPKKIAKGNVCASLPLDDHEVLFCSEDPLTTHDHILHGRCLLTARAPRSRIGQREGGQPDVAASLAPFSLDTFTHVDVQGKAVGKTADFVPSS